MEHNNGCSDLLVQNDVTFWVVRAHIESMCVRNLASDISPSSCVDHFTLVGIHAIDIGWITKQRALLSQVSEAQ